MPVCAAQNLHTLTLAGSADRRRQGSCLAGWLLEEWPELCSRSTPSTARSFDDAFCHRVVLFVCRPTTIHDDISCRAVSSRPSPRPAKRTPMLAGKNQKWVNHLSKLTAAHALRVSRVLLVPDHVIASQPSPPLNPTVPNRQLMLIACGLKSRLQIARRSRCECFVIERDERCSYWIT